MIKKYKKGDYVMLLSQLTHGHVVKDSWITKANGLWKGQKYYEEVALDDGRVYEANDLTYYSEPIRRLAEKIGIFYSDMEKEKDRMNKISDFLKGVGRGTIWAWMKRK